MYFVVELGDAFMRPIFSKLRQDVTQSIGPAGNNVDTQNLHCDLPSKCLRPQSDNKTFVLGDGPVYVGDDDAVVPLPQVDGGLAATGALVLCGHAEHHFVGSITQVQFLLFVEEHK